jgi:hypothetical protein
MFIRATILSGVAAFVLSGAGALAQSDDYNRYGGGPSVSSPDEQYQTEQLNAQGLNGTTSSPAALNGAQTPYANGPANDEEDQQGQAYPSETQYGAPPPEQNAPVGDEAGPPSGPQAQYEQQQQQYQQQMQAYGAQQQDYQYNRQRYDQDIRDYDVAQYAWSYPQPYAYHYGDEYGLQPLYLLAEPSQQLWQAPVEGPGGRWVGRVRNVEAGPDGQPMRIEVALNRRVSVWVRPGDLRFDPDERILYTDLTRDQLWDMPGATIESSPL